MMPYIKIIYCLLLSQVVFVGAFGQTETDRFIENILLKNSDSLERVILQNPAKYKLQIVYTQIDRDKNNHPKFTTYSYRTGLNEYFYPASTVKLYSVALSLEKINQLGIKGLDFNDIMLTDSSYAGQTAVKSDSTAENLRPSIAHYIKKVLVTSDNDGHNRLYEFVGQKDFNEQLKSAGYTNTRITHRLSVTLSTEQNKHTNAINFYDRQTNALLYEQKPAYNDIDFTFRGSIPLGKGYVKGEETINNPMEFNEKNFSSLKDLHHIILSLMFAQKYDKVKALELTADDYRFLRKYMSQLPRETLYPDYHALPDNYCKFFLYGDKGKERIPEHIRIFNKIGNAYGFTIDNAYIVDFDNKVEFALSAVIYTNENEILNDGIYEYAKTAMPFLGNLGSIFYQYELYRKKTHRPDLSDFKFVYDKK